MAVKLHRHEDDVYLSGAGATPCLRWRRQGDQWISAPAELPDGAARATVADVPDDLREELLAFVTRADVMGAVTRPAGN